MSEEKVKKVADFLANWSLSHLGRPLDMASPPHTLEQELISLQGILEQDKKYSQQHEESWHQPPRSRSEMDQMGMP